jgi:hypothetical protein
LCLQLGAALGCGTPTVLQHGIQARPKRSLDLIAGLGRKEHPDRRADQRAERQAEEEIQNFAHDVLHVKLSEQNNE